MTTPLRCTCWSCREMRWWREYWALRGRKIRRTLREDLDDLGVAQRQFVWVLFGRWMRWQ